MAINPTNPVSPPPPTPQPVSVPSETPFGADFETHHFLHLDASAHTLTVDERARVQFAVGSLPGAPDWASKLKAFQQKFGLLVDGKVGRQTWHQIDQLARYAEELQKKGQTLSTDAAAALSPEDLRKGIDSLQTKDPILTVASNTVKAGWKFLNTGVVRVETNILAKARDRFVLASATPNVVSVPYPGPTGHVVSSANVLPVSTPAAVAELQAAASAAGKRVKDTAVALTKLSGADAQKEFETLKTEYGQWQQTVNALVKKGATDVAEVKDFARLTSQAAILHNLIRGDSSGWQAGVDFAAKAKQQIGLDFVATTQGRAPSADKDASVIDQVISNNPLLLVPELRGPMDKPDVKKTVNVTLTYEDQARPPGQPADPAHVHKAEAGPVRNDVVMVFCPGVARTYAEFTDMRAQALLDGVASVRAETGSFIDPDVSADVIKQAVKEAKDLVHNPNAKVILVGHSQGNTNLFAYLKKYPDEAKNVAAIHNIDSAARGSQLADLAYAMGDYLTQDTPPTADQQKLINAFFVAASKQAPNGKLNPAKLEKDFADLRQILIDVRKLVRGSQEVKHLLGLDKFKSDHAVSKAILNWLLTGHLKEHADNVGTFSGSIMDILTRIHLNDQLGQGLLSKVQAQFAKFQPFLGGAFDAAKQGSTPGLVDYLKGYADDHFVKGLDSLTTSYCDKLVNDVKPIVNGIPMLNSVGSIPESRMSDLVPGNQKLFYDFFNTLGLDNDFEVALQNQRLEGTFKSAIDLGPNAIGHWGVTGFVGTGLQTDALFKDWDPPALTDAFLKTIQGMGVI